MTSTKAGLRLSQFALTLCAAFLFSLPLHAQMANINTTNSDGSRDLTACGTAIGCSTIHDPSAYEFAYSKATGKDGVKWCDKWAGPGSWSAKHAEGDGVRARNARANIQACQDAGWKPQDTK